MQIVKYGFSTLATLSTLHIFQFLSYCGLPICLYVHLSDGSSCCSVDMQTDAVAGGSTNLMPLHDDQTKLLKPRVITIRITVCRHEQVSVVLAWYLHSQ